VSVRHGGFGPHHTRRAVQPGAARATADKRSAALGDLQRSLVEQRFEARCRDPARLDNGPARR
jgi:hypothetical protein